MVIMVIAVDAIEMLPILQSLWNGPYFKRFELGRMRFSLALKYGAR